MPWIVPLARLDGEQRSVLDSLIKNPGSQWIRGFAGSGKSILLIHALRELLIRNPGVNACVVAFTHSLKDMLRSGLPDHARRIPVMTYMEFKSNPIRCDYIFVDEVQDLELAILKLLKDNCGTLIMAGDEEQSIYENRVSAEDIKSCTRPTIHSLSIVYRLTERLKKIVATILPGAKVQAARSAFGNPDVRVTLGKATSKDNELRWVWREAQRAARPGEPVCISLSKHRLVQDFIRFVCKESGVPAPAFQKTGGGQYDYGPVNAHLASRGIILRYLGNGYGTLDDSERERTVFVMTYHSSKGLDFETVFLPGLDAGVSFFKKEDENLERRLFYVAATRSRRFLFISYSGQKPHRFVEGMPADLLDRIPIVNQVATTNQTSTDDLF